MKYIHIVVVMKLSTSNNLTTNLAAIYTNYKKSNTIFCLLILLSLSMFRIKSFRSIFTLTNIDSVLLVLLLLNLIVILLWLGNVLTD